MHKRLDPLHRLVAANETRLLAFRTYVVLQSRLKQIVRANQVMGTISDKLHDQTKLSGQYIGQF